MPPEPIDQRQGVDPSNFAEHPRVRPEHCGHLQQDSSALRM